MGPPTQGTKLIFSSVPGLVCYFEREERAKKIDEHKIRVEFIIDPSVYSTEEMTSDPFIFNVTNAVERHHSR